MVLTLQVTRGEDGPSAKLRLHHSIGDEPITLGTDDRCSVVFPRGNGVEACHCALSLVPDGSSTQQGDPRERSCWQLRSRNGSVKIPTLATTDDGGFCQELQAVPEHSAPGWEGMQFVMGGSMTTVPYEVLVEYENDNFGVAEMAAGSSNKLDLRVNQSAATSDAKPAAQQDSMDAMPKTRSLFGLDGMNGGGHVGQATSGGEGCAGGGSCFSLERGYVATPICCPSRSSYLTGKYIHNTGTLQNSAEMGCSSAHWVEQEEPRACE